jgi:protein phosphatase 2C
MLGMNLKQNFVQPNRADEMARIQAAGGRVFYNNGFRVRGILAMSRAIGINV